MWKIILVFDTLHNDEDEGFIETPNPIDGNSDQQPQTNT